MIGTSKKLRPARAVHRSPVVLTPERRPKRWRRGWLVAALLVAAIPLIPGLRPGDWLARTWRARWAVVPTSVAVKRIAALPRLGPTGYELLVDALADRRLAVVRAAAQQLELEYESWTAQPSADAARSAACVLARLNLRTDAIAPASYPTVERLARGLIVRQVDPAIVDELKWIMDCESLLMFIEEQKQAAMLARKNPVAPETNSNEKQRVESPPGDEPPLPPSFVSLLSDDLPITRSAPSLPARADLALPEEPPRTIPRTKRRATSGINEETRELDLQQATEAELLEMLADAEAEAVLRAAAELKRRGYSQEMLTMAEHLVDPAADVRLAMAQQLPELPIDQLRPWLLRLSHDEDLRVRRLAVSHLAASADPQLRRRLRELEATENDPVILRRIEQSNRQ